MFEEVDGEKGFPCIFFTVLFYSSSLESLWPSFVNVAITCYSYVYFFNVGFSFLKRVEKIVTSFLLLHDLLGNMLMWLGIFYNLYEFLLKFFLFLPT